MTYLTLREREARLTERLQLLRMVVEYSIIGGVIAWVIGNF